MINNLNTNPNQTDNISEKMQKYTERLHEQKEELILKLLMRKAQDTYATSDYIIYQVISDLCQHSKCPENSIYVKINRILSKCNDEVDAQIIQAIENSMK
jgi:hemerythrin-like domain-containing protein